MLLDDEIKYRLKAKGVALVEFVDISLLSYEMNKGYSTAILIGIPLSRGYLGRVAADRNYVRNMIRDKKVNEDEFHLTELMTDRLADETAYFLNTKGHSAYSQSEDNIFLTGFYNMNKSSTPLPHKTIALKAGLGWIGKHNLLITEKYGSALSMCTVLTDAPLKTAINKVSENSKCGSCGVCKEVCTQEAIKGKLWKPGISRDDLIDVTRCSPCLQCMVHCPYTQKYMNSTDQFSGL